MGYAPWICKKNNKRKSTIMLQNTMSTVNSTNNIHNIKLTQDIIEKLKQYQNENLSTEIKKGLKENVMMGLSTGGKCLGYDTIDKHYAINFTEANAVRTIFELYDMGFSYSTISAELNSYGYKTKSGNDFSPKSLYKILGNCRYKGDLVYNSDEGIHISGTIPAIVSAELFDCVQVRIKKMKHKHPEE